MNFFKRAMISITRRKGKSIILFAVIFILGNVMAGAIAIDQGTKSVEGTIKKKLGSVATITTDYDAVDEDAGDNYENEIKINPPSQETIDEIGKLDEVNYYDYSINDFLTTENFKMVQSKDGNVQYGDGNLNYFAFKGVNYNEVLDIKNNIIKLEEGNVFDKEQIEKASNVILISDEVAKANNVRVGDKITLDLISRMGQFQTDDGKVEETQDVKKDYQMEVIGIFKVIQAEKKESNQSQNQKVNQESNYLDRVNTIYAPNNYVMKVSNEFRKLDMEANPSVYGNPSKEEMEEQLNNGDYGTATYTLKSPEVTEEFRTKANKLLEDSKSKYAKILISSDQYDKVAGPVKGMAKISKLVLIISIVASILIITLVTILFLRDRKHELGIYLSLGEQRIKVIGQIVIEVVVIALVAITISVFTGNLVAKSFSQSLVESQKTESNNANYIDNDSWQYSQLTNNDISEDDVVEAYNISLNASYIVLFYIVGIGVVLVSTIVPLIYILRLNPKKIMM